MNPEVYSYLIPKLFELGALDVYLTPVLMKKGRQANILHVLSTPEAVLVLKRAIFRETTTLGIRECQVNRESLERASIKVESKYGEIRVKAAYLDGELLKGAPEYEDCRAAALKYDVPIREVYEQVNTIFRENYKGDPECE